VLVCGRRYFCDGLLLLNALSDLHRSRWIKLIIHGGASRGADQIAGTWAAQRQVPVEVFKPDWIKWRYSAGPVRNQCMISDGRPDLVVAAPGGGYTTDCIRRAERAGIKVWKLG
jgi:SLOG family YspA-like protein